MLSAALGILGPLRLVVKPLSRQKLSLVWTSGLWHKCVGVECVIITSSLKLFCRNVSEWVFACMCVSSRLPQKPHESRKPSPNIRLVLVCFAYVIVSSEDVTCFITYKAESGSRRIESELQAWICWLSIAAGHQQHCNDKVSHYLPTQTHIQWPRVYAEQLVEEPEDVCCYLRQNVCVLCLSASSEGWYDGVSEAVINPFFALLMESQREEVSVNASFIASLLTMVRYSCPQVYNKSRSVGSGLLKPVSVGEGYVCVMSQCVTVCVYVNDISIQGCGTCHATLDSICLSWQRNFTQASLTSFFWSLAIFLVEEAYDMNDTIIIRIFIELKQLINLL